MFDSSIYTIGWVCALRTELVAAAEHLDEEHDASEYESPASDNNTYVFGRIGKHNVVIATLPRGEYGTNNAASVARDMVRSFTNVRIGLMVGIGGGAPGPTDVRLGDVVVSVPKDGQGGVWQYDYGKAIQGQGFEVTGHLNSPPQCLLIAMNVLGAEFERKGNQLDQAVQDVLASKNMLQKTYQRPDSSTDRLYKASSLHEGSDCSTCIGGLVDREEREEDVVVHEGLIASANQLMKDATIRDDLAKNFGVLCFEMEAAGLMNQFPFLVVRGICDYCDTHKNKSWQGYAAMTAAAYTRKLVLRLAPTKVKAEASLSKIMENLTGINEGLARVEQQLQKHTARGLRKDIDRWLAAPDPTSNFRTSLQLREPATGAWLFESDKYQQWKKGIIRHLWCHGKAGCGKSVMVGSIIEDIRRYCETASDLGSAIFYFTFSDTSKQSHADCLRSLVWQMAHFESVSSELEDLFKLRKPSDFTPNEDDLQNVFRNKLNSYRQFFLILDALDEVPETSRKDNRPREQLINWIRTICTSIPQLQVLATSRHLLDIGEGMDGIGFTSMSMVTECVNNDIKIYVTNNLNSDRRLCRLNEALKQKVQNVFSERADGMFRWAYCQMNELKNLKSTQPSDFERALKNLPTNLDETYDRMLAAIPLDLQDRAINLLRWLAYARRPMTLLELSEARIIDLEGPKGRVHTADRGNPEDVLEILLSLIVIMHKAHPTTNKVFTSHSVADTLFDGKATDPHCYLRLAHFSIQEYLESRRILASRASSFHLERVRDEHALAECCIVYLMHYGEQEQEISAREIFEALPLLAYAADHWYSHCQEEKDINKTTLFLQSEAALSRWKMIRNRGQKTASGVYYAAQFGFNSVIRRLIDLGVDVKTAGGGQLGTPLQAATFGKHISVVKTLTDAGVHVNNGSVVLAAIRAKNIPILKILIKSGGNVNISTQHGNSYQPLIVGAAKEGHLRLVQTLVEDGQADVNLPTGDGKTALMEASAKNHTDIVEYLLKHKANTNTTCWTYGTALIASINHGYKDISRLLIEHGADVNVSSDNAGTALIAAVNNQDKEMLKLLIERGADIDAPAPRRGTALIAAAAGANTEILETLVQHGADVNLEAGVYGTALIAALASPDSMEILKFLIERGANINAQPDSHGPILIVAARLLDVELVRLLVEHGADVNARWKYDTALEVAIRRGHREIVQELLANDADVNAAGQYGTPLELAQAIGADYIIQMLQEYGAKASSI